MVLWFIAKRSFPAVTVAFSITRWPPSVALLSTLVDPMEGLADTDNGALDRAGFGDHSIKSPSTCHAIDHNHLAWLGFDWHCIAQGECQRATDQ